MVGIEKSAPVQPTVLQTACLFRANNDVVGLGPPRARRGQTPGGIPANTKSEARTSEKRSPFSERDQGGLRDEPQSSLVDVLQHLY